MHLKFIFGQSLPKNFTRHRIFREIRKHFNFISKIIPLLLKLHERAVHFTLIEPNPIRHQ